MANGNGESGRAVASPVTALVIISSVVGTLIVIVVALWTIISNENANNKAITDELRGGYITKTNHQDLVDRFQREVTRVDGVAAKLDNDMLPRKEFERWKVEHDTAIKDLKKKIEKLDDSKISKSEFKGVVDERGTQIEALRRELERLSGREDLRHVNDRKSQQQQQ